MKIELEKYFADQLFFFECSWDCETMKISIDKAGAEYRMFVSIRDCREIGLNHQEFEDDWELGLFLEKAETLESAFALALAARTMIANADTWRLAVEKMVEFGLSPQQLFAALWMEVGNES